MSANHKNGLPAVYIILIYYTLLPSRLFCFLVVPYVHVLGLVLAHVAVITLSDAPIAGYNPAFFSRYLLLFVLIYYLLLS